MSAVISICFAFGYHDLSVPSLRQLRSFWPPLVLFAQVLVFYARVVLTRQYVIPWDFRYYHYPLFYFMAQSFRRGELPLWDPYTYCGLPFYAGLQNQVFYPPTVLAVLVSNMIGGGHLLYLMELQLVAHVFLGGYFTYLLLRALGTSRGAAVIGASIFQLGPFFVSQAQHLHAVDSAAWLPLALLSVVRLSGNYTARWVAILAISWAMCVLAGFPAVIGLTFLCSFLVAAILIACRLARPKVLAAMAAALVLAIGIAAVLLLPGLELIRTSVSTLRSSWRGTDWGIPLPALITLLIPDYFHVSDLSKYSYPKNATFMYLYVGLITLALVAIALFRKSRYSVAFALFTAVSLFFMLGHSTLPGRLILGYFLDLTHDAIYLEFMLVGFSLGMAILAGLGADRIVRGRGWVAAILTVLIFVDLYYAGAGRPMNTSSIAHEPGITHDTFDGNAQLLPAIRQLINKSTPPARTDIYDASINWAGTAPLVEIPTANGYDPVAQIRLMQVRLLFCNGQDWGRYYTVAHLESPILDLLNIGYIFSQHPISSPKYENVEIAGQVLLRNKTVLPRFFLVGNVVPVPDMKSALARMSSPDFNGAATAIVEGPVSLHSADPPGTVKVVSFGPSKIILDVDALRAAYLVTSEAYSPGWRARVNGRAVPIEITNAAFRGLAIAPGQHRVEMEFRPRILAVSASISLIAVLIATFLIIWKDRSRQTRPTPGSKILSHRRR
jgi:hypothetical protein